MFPQAAENAGLCLAECSRIHIFALIGVSLPFDHRDGSTFLQLSTSQFEWVSEEITSVEAAEGEDGTEQMDWH